MIYYNHFFILVMIMSYLIVNSGISLYNMVDNLYTLTYIN